MIINIQKKQNPRQVPTILHQPAGLWHDGGKEDDKAQLGEEEPVEDPPIVEPSEDLLWKFTIYFQFGNSFFLVVIKYYLASHG